MTQTPDVCCDGFVVDIAVKDFVKLGADVQRCLLAFRAPVDFEARSVPRDAYEFGVELATEPAAARIPLEYRANSRETRLALLAALLDACGQVAGAGVRLDTALLGAKSSGAAVGDQKKCAADELSADVLFLARSLGLRARVAASGCKRKRAPQRPSGALLQLCGAALADVPCRRLALPAQVGAAAAAASGERFELALLRDGDYFGFTIDGNHRFLLGSFVVTHNTTTINAIARQLYGPTLYKTRMLELNASDERGISVVRDKVKSFASLSVGARPANSKYPMPPYKLVVLDEADSMTGDAQAALRRIMENYSKATRFVSF